MSVSPGAPMPLIALPVQKREWDRVRLPLGRRHRLPQSAELLVPGLDDVLAGGKPVQRERAVVARDLMKRVALDGDESAHPGMDVAANRDHLRRGKGPA